ncbi:hypothetical protein HPB52_012784 [Rhipicephalus sanguineus]|uniref:Uncharacterized protein n=1 Tax=Rhipicephalus sanguineus TaxID=34632 RepID=A0A9D4PW37_RHISA|nr:hypothetical protein HPB52_012784 [Rhipicephalus sanguineus]
MPDGSESENVADIDRTFSEYFTNLFSEGDPDTGADVSIRELERLCGTVPKLPAEASGNLLKAVSAAEVFVTLRSMKVGSAPGPDGLPIEFYKEFWREIGTGLRTGVAADVWDQITQEVVDSTQKAIRCKFSFSAEPFFFWDGSTERLRRDVLRLPRRLGGYGLPCLATTAQLLALKTVLGVLDDVAAPARPLAMFFLGPLRRALVPRALGNLYPSAENTPPYYKALVALFRELTTVDPDLEPKKSAQRSPPPTFPWIELTSGRLPKEVADVQWQRAWRILPTLDRLQSWGIVQYARCPNCGSTETAAHAWQRVLSLRLLETNTQVFARFTDRSLLHKGPVPPGSHCTSFGGTAAEHASVGNVCGYSGRSELTLHRVAEKLALATYDALRASHVSDHRSYAAVFDRDLWNLDRVCVIARAASASQGLSSTEDEGGKRGGPSEGATSSLLRGLVASVVPVLQRSFARANVSALCTEALMDFSRRILRMDIAAWSAL